MSSVCYGRRAVGRWRGGDRVVLVELGGVVTWGAGIVVVVAAAVGGWERDGAVWLALAEKISLN